MVSFKRMERGWMYEETIHSEYINSEPYKLFWVQSQGKMVAV